MSLDGEAYVEKWGNEAAENAPAFGRIREMGIPFALASGICVPLASLLSCLAAWARRSCTRLLGVRRTICCHSLRRTIACRRRTATPQAKAYQRTQEFRDIRSNRAKIKG
jgi:hypothetical protein